MVSASSGAVLRPDVWLHSKGVMTWRRVYPGRLDQIARVRAWVAVLLADTDCADDAVLISTELVSNALLHTRSGEPGGWFGVEVSRASQACVAVHDLGGSPAPQFTSAPAESRDAPAEHGYGLRVVAGLAAQVGVTGSPDSGHTVWARLPPDPAPTLQAI